MNENDGKFISYRTIKDVSISLQLIADPWLGRMNIDIANRSAQGNIIVNRSLPERLIGRLGGLTDILYQWE
jgi:hypothetical protein